MAAEGILFVNDHLQFALFSKALSTGLQDYSRLVNLSYLLMQTANVNGAIVECGVFQGDTAMLLASLSDKAIFLCDSFDGLSAPGEHDLNQSPFVEHAMTGCEKCVSRQFAFHGLRKPIVRNREISAIKPDDLPDQIAFGHIDLDLHQPTLDALGLLWPKMVLGGIVVIDDVNHPELPGVKKALETFIPASMIQQPLGINGQPSLHAYIQK